MWLQRTKRSMSGPATCQAQDCGKEMKPSMSWTQPKFYCSAKCRKRAAVQRKKLGKRSPFRRRWDR